MTYKTALQAIAISSAERQATWCESAPENIAFLLLECSDEWVEYGVRTFACTERGSEWTVKVEEVAP